MSAEILSQTQSAAAKQLFAGALLIATNLQKSFYGPDNERIDVLRGVDLAVAAGETVAIVGASGAGKSTLLHLLGGLEDADDGSIQLAASLSKPRAGNAQTRIGFVFQFHHLLAELTAVENVALPLLIARRGQRESLQRATLLLEQAGLGERCAYKIGELSGGEQQRVAIARALVNDPSLVLADEPTGNLDAAIGTEVADLLLQYAHEQQAAVITATHNTSLAARCDRTLLLKDGQLVTEPNPRLLS